MAESHLTPPEVADIMRRMPLLMTRADVRAFARIGEHGLNDAEKAGYLKPLRKGDGKGSRRVLFTRAAVLSWVLRTPVTESLLDEPAPEQASPVASD